MPSPTEITVTQLSRLIGTSAAPLLIDVRIDEDFNLDPNFIPASRQWPHRDIAQLAADLKNHQVVLYCQKGKKISQGAMALLRNQGVNAESLAGGHFAWRDAGLPLVPADKIPPRNTLGQTVWVTRHRPKIDRMACPWLIRRFIDPQAQFLFVAPAEVMGVAQKFDAIPFDVEDVFWTHRGQDCWRYRSVYRACTAMTMSRSMQAC